MNDINKGLIIAGVFSAETPDKTSEIIKISGVDISSLNDGTAILNSEHNSGSFSNYLGRITSAKKIFKDEDCKNDHERKCFENVGKVPMIYGTAMLFDDQEGHSEAKHAAGVMKHFKKHNLPITARFSLEGSSLDKDGNLINRSIARRIALTISPCNTACESDIISEFSKSEKDSYSNITKNYTDAKGVDCDLLVIDQADIMKSLGLLQNNLQKLQKALEAGVAVGAPGTLTQGAALGKQNRPSKKKEETILPGEETTRKEDSKELKPLDEDKADKIDEKAKDLNIKEIKLKKANVFIYKNLLALQKAK